MMTKGRKVLEIIGEYVPDKDSIMIFILFHSLIKMINDNKKLS
jgi:hypothetical protein